jgi:hypothetical protein
VPCVSHEGGIYTPTLALLPVITALNGGLKRSREAVAKKRAAGTVPRGGQVTLAASSAERALAAGKGAGAFPVTSEYRSGGSGSSKALGILKHSRTEIVPYAGSGAAHKFTHGGFSHGKSLSLCHDVANATLRAPISSLEMPMIKWDTACVVASYYYVQGGSEFSAVAG